MKGRKYAHLLVVTVLALSLFGLVIKLKQDTPASPSSAATLGEELDVCTITTNASEWENRGNRDLPASGYRSYDHVVLPKDSSGQIWLQQTVLSLDGKTLNSRYLRWDQANNKWLLDSVGSGKWQTAAASGKPPFDKPNSSESFRSFDQIVFPNNKLKQTYLSQDGKNIYFRNLDWNGSSWINITAWTKRDSDLPVKGNEYRSFDHVVYPANSSGVIKLRQSVLDGNGKILHIRYLSWNGSSWTSSNNYQYEDIDRGFPNPNPSGPAYLSFDQVVFPDNKIKQYFIEDNAATGWAKYQSWGKCNSGLKKFAYGVNDSVVGLYARIPVDSGIYDQASNKTFIVYSGGLSNVLGKTNYSDTSPYIIAYNHSNNQWSEPKMVYDVTRDPDAHFYPQIVIDNAGYLHVFHSFHNSDQNIVHAVSTQPRDISGWKNSEISNTKKNTYVIAYKSQTGKLFLLYRYTLDSPGSPFNIQERISVSEDNGQNWSQQSIIDIQNNGTSSDQEYFGINTAKHFNKPFDSVHFTFFTSRQASAGGGWISQYYAVLNLSNNHVYCAKPSSNGSIWTDYGETLYRSDYEKNCKLFEMPYFVNTSGNSRMAIGLDSSGFPHVFSTYFADANGQNRQLARIDWTGSYWSSPQIISQLGDYVQPYKLVFNSPSNIYLYAIKDWESVYKYHYNGTSWDATTIYTDSQPTIGGLDQILEITNGRPEVNSIFNDGQFSDWSQPNPFGKNFSYGI